MAAEPLPGLPPDPQEKAPEGFKVPGEGASGAISAVTVIALLVLWFLVTNLGLIEPLFLGDAPKVYSGPLKLAQDGMMISLPAGSSAVNFSSAF